LPLGGFLPLSIEQCGTDLSAEGSSADWKEAHNGEETLISPRGCPGRSRFGPWPADYDKHFVLTAEIDLSGITFGQAVIAPDADISEPGFQGTRFSGVLDGNNHVIGNLHIEGRNFLGRFGYVTGAAVNNLGLENAWVLGTKDYVGSLVGYNLCGSISKAYCTCQVTGRDNIGGLVGYNFYGAIFRKIPV